jgi:hypothetical protein
MRPRDGNSQASATAAKSDLARLVEKARGRVWPGVCERRAFSLYEQLVATKNQWQERQHPDRSYSHAVTLALIYLRLLMSGPKDILLSTGSSIRSWGVTA